MHALIFLLVLCGAPSLTLPLFYLRPQKNRLYSWFLFVILAYGSLGILLLPQSLFINISGWFPTDAQSYQWLEPVNLVQHFAAFIFCLWYLPRFRMLLRLEQVA